MNARGGAEGNGLRPYADVETSSAQYARRFAGPVGRWFLDVQARAVLDLLAPWPAARILDVGGGHAQLAGPLASAGHAVTVLGSDVSCAARLEGLAVEFRAGDLLEPPFPARSFDAVVCFRLLPHIARWEALVGALCGLATRAVIVDYPTTRSLNALAGTLFGLKKTVEKDTREFAVFRDAEVEQAFAAGGFRPTARRAQFVLPMALHRGLRLAPLSRVLEAGARALGLTAAFGSPVILRADRRDG
jgi:2-polyprenyl-3-methyl-5-hydroxy-6-metoxy-1,4-benzoquinol methylase